MIPYLRSLLMEKGAFVGFFRAALACLGLGVETDRIPVPEGYEWVGILGVGAALMMRSSVKSPEPKPKP